MLRNLAVFLGSSGGAEAEIDVVETRHERKAVMADRADVFLALPGGDRS